MLPTPTLPVATPPDTDTRPATALAATPGSWDHAQPVDQMRAIDMAMRWYFESEDWLDERRTGNTLR